VELAEIIGLTLMLVPTALGLVWLVPVIAAIQGVVPPAIGWRQPQ
jgi:hypothetical protein